MVDDQAISIYPLNKVFRRIFLKKGRCRFYDGLVSGSIILAGIMSDWLDLSEHKHLNCYLDRGPMTGVGPLRMVGVAVYQIFIKCIMQRWDTSQKWIVRYIKVNYNCKIYCRFQASHELIKDCIEVIRHLLDLWLLHHKVLLHLE